MGDIFRGVFLWLYWIGALTLIGWNVFHQEYTKSIIYFIIAFVVYLFVFCWIWRKQKKKNKGESSFFDFLDCDGLDCDGGGDGGGFGGGD